MCMYIESFQKEKACTYQGIIISLTSAYQQGLAKIKMWDFMIKN